MYGSNSAVTRRGFVAGIGAAIAGSGVMAGGALANAPQSAENFDETYDVVVVGYGLAGASAAVYAADGGAHVLLIDAAPEGHEGGNSRYCGQLCLYTKDEKKLLGYLRNLAVGCDMDDEVLQAYAAGIADVADVFHHFGIEEPLVWSDYIANNEEDAQKTHVLGAWKAAFPEWREVEGSEAVDVMTVHAGVSDGALYGAAQEAVAMRENITVWLESPAHRLITNDSNEVVGIVVDHEGTETRIEVSGGIVLASGGFECNHQMIQDYLGVSRLAPLGGLYNNGDGIRMAQEVGADLWHMTNYESLGMLGGNQFEVAEGERALMVSNFTPAIEGALVCVGDTGERFFAEDSGNRHGHIKTHGVWRIPNTSARPHIVFDEQQKAVIEDAGLMPVNVDNAIVSAASPEELASLIGADPEALAATIAAFNDFAASGRDAQFGRAAETMRPFEGDAYYALPLQPCVLNTQGGPRRNAKAQVVAIDGSPIAGLFSAGECGGVTANRYQGGGNVAECLVFGRIAGTNAATGLR